MTILEPLKWTYCGDLERNWFEASHCPFHFIVLVNKEKYVPQIILQGCVLDIWSQSASTLENAKAMIDHWRKTMINSQLTAEARAVFSLYFFNPTPSPT